MLKNVRPFTGLLRGKLHSARHEQTRTTVILKRKNPVNISKLTDTKHKPLKKRHAVYLFDEITEATKKENIDVILTEHVQGKGDKWDIVSVPPVYAQLNLILPGLAIYASPENLALRERCKEEKTVTGPTYSSPYASLTIRLLQSRVYSLSMNRDVPWTVEPWHIRVALRKAGVVVPDERIGLPETPITGPDPGKHNKVFAVTIMINGKDKAQVLMRLHHIHKGYRNEEKPKVPFYEMPITAFLPEQEELVAQLSDAQERARKAKEGGSQRVSS